MKVIAFQTDKTVLVKMDFMELLNLAGFRDGATFNSDLKVNAMGYSSVKSQSALMSIDIPVSDIYKDAKETLATYSELKSKLESVRNQLTTLTGKMQLVREAI